MNYSILALIKVIDWRRMAFILKNELFIDIVDFIMSIDLFLSVKKYFQN